MDCTKIGGLILQLRTEKGLTQRQVAEQLNISNKTVSKWERGLGCPDVSLWDGLSAVLGADLIKLLQGELGVNRPDSGRMDRIRFYVCPYCGNIMTSTGSAALSCCGRKLKPLAAAPCTPEHQPDLQPIDIEDYVTLDHPMQKDHFISFAAYVLDDRVLLVRLYPEQDAAFYLPPLRKGGTLYLYCTRHGLQKYPVRRRQK